MTTEIQILKDYIKNEIGYNGEVEPDTNLFETGILDSFSIIQTAVFIQEQFKIELDAEDLVRDQLSTLSHMAALIDKQKASNN